METESMGRVRTEANVQNLEDLWAVKRGLLPPDQARSITVTDALVDTGATLISLPTHLIRQLGLSKTPTKRVNSSVGPAEADLYEAVRRTGLSSSIRWSALRPTLRPRQHPAT